MAARPHDLVLTFILLLLWLTPPSSGGGSEKHRNGGDRYVRDACSVTRYPDICIHSLGSYSRTAKNNPSKWARAGVSVAIGESKKVSEYLGKLKKANGMRGRNRIALWDCIECIQDSLDDLHRSLGVLRKLSSQTFDLQMEDVISWMSSALTDEDTCLDGFQAEGDHHTPKQVQLLLSRVSNLTYITSNALALVNKLATNGP